MYLSIIIYTLQLMYNDYGSPRLSYHIVILQNSVDIHNIPRAIVRHHLHRDFRDLPISS